MGTYYSEKERRITIRLMAYWEKLRNGRAMPHENDIDPEHIADLWDHCFLVRVTDIEKHDYSYTYIGEAITEAYNQGLTEPEKSGIVSPNVKKLVCNYEHILSTAHPIVEEGELSNLRGDTIKYRQCLLPLGTGNKVEAIFGGMRFKVFPKSW